MTRGKQWRQSENEIDDEVFGQRKKNRYSTKKSAADRADMTADDDQPMFLAETWNE